MFFLFFMPTGMQNVAVLQEQGAGLPRTYFIPLKKRLMCAQEVEALREAVADAQAAAARAQAGLRRAERQAACARSERRADTSQLALVQV